MRQKAPTSPTDARRRPLRPGVAQGSRGGSRGVYDRPVYEATSVSTAFVLGLILGVALGLTLWLVILPAVAHALRHDR